jgi:hypothetical protein
MASEKAWYWLAAGVLALGINGAYQDGGFRWAHQLAERSSAMFERVSEQGCRLVSMAEIILGREPATLARAQEHLAQLQERMSTRETDRAQRRLEMAQAKIERAQEKVERAHLCSEFSRIQVHVPRVVIPPMPAIHVPAMDMQDFSPRVNVGPIHVPSVHIPAIRVPATPQVDVNVDVEDPDGLI